MSSDSSSKDRNLPDFARENGERCRCLRMAQNSTANGCLERMSLKALAFGLERTSGSTRVGGGTIDSMAREGPYSLTGMSIKAVGKTTEDMASESTSTLTEASTKANGMREKKMVKASRHLPMETLT